MIHNISSQNTITDSNFASALKSPSLFRPIPEVDLTKSSDNDVRRPRTEFVLRGEFLQNLNSSKSFRPSLNQQIAPENEMAIDAYQKIAPAQPDLPARQGQIVNFFI